jgi:ABC-type uncharacterized transport system substrate-binding protein
LQSDIGRIDRRAFIIGLGSGILAAPLAGEAQQSGKIPRIGYLATRHNEGLINAFKQGLSEHGYVEGQNIAIEWRFSEGSFDRVPALATELAKLKVDVIFAVNPENALPTKNVIKDIPIVFAVGDPVANGLVKSLARPGGNVTGLASISSELGAKRLELLKGAAPEISRVAVLWNPAKPGHPLALTNAQDAAHSLKLQLHALEVRGSSDLRNTFKAANQWRANGLIVLDDSVFFNERTQIVELAARSRLPDVYGFRESAEAGGLMAYGANLRDQWRRAATYVVRMIRGAKPGDLPVEQPTKFELIINLKTAKALGLTIPPPLLLRADEVIQ